MTQDQLDEASGNELIEAYLSQKDMHRNEGTTGVRNLEKFLSDLQYRSGAFMGDHPILNFLADNPGAIEAIYDFVGEYIEGNDDWTENITDCIEVEDEEVDDEPELGYDE